jgi:hypothetical protein
MSLRKVLLACVVGLGASVLPGCTSATGFNINPREHIPELPDQSSHRPDSPYHQQPDPGHPSPQTIKLTNHEEPATEAPPRPKKEETPVALPPLPAQPPASPPLPIPAAVPTEQQQESKKTTPTDEPLVVALRAYLQKRPADALDALAHYEKSNQEDLLAVLPFAARLTEGDVNKMSPREAAELADLMQSVEERLRQRAALRIEKMLFCRKIDDFGEFTVRESVNGIPTFEGGVSDQPGEPVQVYVELRNVSSRPIGDTFETRLTGSIELFDFQNHSAYRKDFAPEVHRGRSSRHDFFVNCSFSVPRKVPPGRYTLRVEVRDITGLTADSTGRQQTPPPHHIASKSLDLQVIEPRPEHAATR